MIEDRIKPDYVWSADDLDCSASLVLLVKEIADYCERIYPGWGWTVQPDERGGVINLRALKLHGEYGYIMKIADVQNDPKRRVAKMAAGEILERFGQRRGRFNYKRWLKIPRNLAGDCMPDLSDKSSKKRRMARDKAINDAVRRGKAKFHTTDRGGVRHVVLERR